MSPVGEHFHDGQEFSFVDVIVSFCGSEGDPLASQYPDQVACFQDEDLQKSCLSFCFCFGLSWVILRLSTLSFECYGSYTHYGADRYVSQSWCLTLFIPDSASTQDSHLGLWTEVSTWNQPLTWTIDPELWPWPHNSWRDRSNHNVTPYLWSRAWHHSLSMTSAMTSSFRPLPHGSYLWLRCPKPWLHTLNPNRPRPMTSDPVPWCLLYIRVANWSHTTSVCSLLSLAILSPLHSSLILGMLLLPKWRLWHL